MFSTFEADVLSPFEDLSPNSRISINLSNCSVSVAQMNILVDKLKTHVIPAFEVYLNLVNIERDALPILTDFLNQNGTGELSAHTLCTVFLLDTMRLLDPVQTKIKENFSAFVGNITDNTVLIFSAGKSYSQGQRYLYTGECSPSGLTSAKDISDFFSLINRCNVRAGVTFSSVDLGEMGDDLFSIFIQECVKNKIAHIEMTNCRLERINPAILKELVLSLLETPVTYVDLRYNELLGLNPVDLKEISLKVEQKESLQLFNLYSNGLTDTVKAVISGWSKDWQKASLEAQISFQYRSSIPQALFAPGLTSEEFTEIVVPFFDQYSPNSSDILDFWLASHPVLKKIEADLRLKASLSYIKSFVLTAEPYSKLSTSFDFSCVTQATPATEQLMSEMKKYKQFLYSLTIEVRLLDQTEEEIAYLAQFINQLELPEPTILRLNETMLAKKGLARILALMGAITNQAVTGLELKGNDFSIISESEHNTFFANLGGQSHLRYLGLEETKLGDLGAESVVRHLTVLNQDNKLIGVRLLGNNLVKLGFDFLLSLNRVSRPKNQKTCFDFADEMNDIVAATAAEDRLELMKMQYRGYYIVGKIFSDGQAKQLTSPTSQELCSVIADILTVATEKDVWFIAKRIGEFSLEPRERAEVIRKCIEFDSSFISCLEEMKFSKTPETDRVDIFLMASEKYPMDFFRASAFFLYDSEQPANKILFALKEIMDELAAGVDEEDYIGEKIRETGLPALRNACRDNLPPLSFVEKCLDSIESHQTSDTIFPFLRMVAWFTWGCSKLANLPALTEVLRQKQGQSFSETFNKVMKQILDFAHPQMRYNLTSIFFEKICGDQERIYFSLVEGQAVDSLLPAILLTDIVLQEADESSRPALLSQVKELLPLCHGAKFSGRFYRTMMGGVAAISTDTILPPAQKIRLIQKILSANSVHFQRVETLLSGFFEEFYQEKEVDRRERVSSLEDALKRLDENILAHLGVAKHVKTLEAAREGGRAKALKKAKKSIVETTLPQYYRDAEFKNRMGHFRMVQGLAYMGHLSKLVSLSSQDFEEQARKIFQKLFELSDTQLSYYDETFGQCSNETALLTYYSKMQSLTDSKADEARKTFKLFVQSVLSPQGSDFYKMRYNPQLNPQLDDVFTVSPTLKTRWEKDADQDLEAFIQENKITAREYKPDFENFVSKALRHRHLDPKYYGLLEKYLATKETGQREKIKEEIQTLSLEYSSAKKKDNQAQQLSPEAAHALIQLQLLDLLEKPINLERSLLDRHNEHLKILNKILNVMAKCHSVTGGQFKHDVSGLITGLKSNKRPSTAMDLTGWKVVETANFWRLFMCGTDVEGSCQSVDGDPSLNKCLMGYVMSGHVKMLAILNAKGETVARCMLKLSTVEESGKPALFLEEIYPDAARPILREALIQFAIKRAETLGLPLGTVASFPAPSDQEIEVFDAQNEPDEDNTSQVWVCAGGMAPFEYVDALFEPVEGGYALPNVQLLYRPTLAKVFENTVEQFSRRLSIAEGSFSEESGGSSPRMETAWGHHRRSSSLGVEDDRMTAAAKAEMETYKQ